MIIAVEILFALFEAFLTAIGYILAFAVYFLIGWAAFACFFIALKMAGIWSF